MLSAGLKNVIFYKIHQVLRIKMSLSPLPDHIMPAWYLKSLQFIIPTADAVPGYGASAENDGEKKNLWLPGRELGCSKSCISFKNSPDALWTKGLRSDSLGT